MNDDFFAILDISKEKYHQHNVLDDAMLVRDVFLKLEKLDDHNLDRLRRINRFELKY